MDCFLRLSVTSTLRNVIILCALDSPYLKQPFQDLEVLNAVILFLENFLEPFEGELNPKHVYAHKFWVLNISFEFFLQNLRSDIPSTVSIIGRIKINPI